MAVFEPTTAFEYRIERFSSGWKGIDDRTVEQRLNEVGREGWEAVSTYLPSTGNGQVLELSVLLKRARA